MIVSVRMCKLDLLPSNSRSTDAVKSVSITSRCFFRRSYSCDSCIRFDTKIRCITIMMLEKVRIYGEVFSGRQILKKRIFASNKLIIKTLILRRTLKKYLCSGISVSFFNFFLTKMHQIFRRKNAHNVLRAFTLVPSSDLSAMLHYDGD